MNAAFCVQHGSSGDSHAIVQQFAMMVTKMIGSKGFDSTAYLAAFGDVAQARLDPMQHYLQYGATEGRSTFGDTTFGVGTVG